MIAAKILRPKALLSFSLAMLISLTTANLMFAFFYGFTTSLTHSLSGFSGGMVILQEGAKSIHTSRVPLSLAESLRKLPCVKAHAVTLTPLTVRGKPIMFRGVSMLDDYAQKIVEGSVPTEGGLWVLLGERASERLSLKTGDIVVTGSPLAPSIITLYVVGIYRLGDLRDYEAIVPYEVGAELAGLSRGLASAIHVDGIEKEKVESLLKSLYTLTIKHDAGKGEVMVLDSLNIPVASFTIDEPGAKIFQLPFGYYTLVYREPYLTANLTNILLTEDRTLTLATPDTSIFKLKVIAPEAECPILQLEDGNVTQGVWMGNTWIFEAPRGLHLIRLGEAIYPIPLMGDTIFSPHVVEEAKTRIEISVHWQDGAYVTDYLISIWDAGGALLASTVSSSPLFAINLPEGEYEAEVSKPPYLVRMRLRVPEQRSVTLSLPVISNPSRITPRLFQQLRAVTPIDASAATIASLIGLTTSSLAALMISLSILSIISVFTIQKGLYVSAEDNLRVLWALGAGKGRILRIIGLKTLGLNLALGLGAAYLAQILHKHLSFNLALTVLGYGLQAEPYLTLAHALILSIISWLLFVIKLTPKMDAEE